MDLNARYVYERKRILQYRYDVQITLNILITNLSQIKLPILIMEHAIN